MAVLNFSRYSLLSVYVKSRAPAILGKSPKLFWEEENVFLGKFFHFWERIWEDA